jgi:hypothetical protein
VRYKSLFMGLVVRCMGKDGKDRKGKLKMKIKIEN